MAASACTRCAGCFTSRLLHPQPTPSQAEEAAAAAAAEEAAAAEARKQRQVEKKALQRERARLRRLCAGEGGSEGSGLPAGSVDSDDVEHLCSNLGLEALQRLCDQLAAVDLAADAKRGVIAQQLEAVGRQLQREQAQKDAAAQVSGEGGGWVVV